LARVLAAQLVRCGTSIGANLEEARGGKSRPDFISKCSIALKEARETSFRLRVAGRCELGPIVRNARRNARQEGRRKGSRPSL
jgi:four helix bundle protein